MNIFKVLASGNKNMNEETISAVLAWLLSPQMEHGLEYNFLINFLKLLVDQADRPKNLEVLVNKLQPSLRDDGSETPSLECYIEYPVITNFKKLKYIDVVFVIDKMVFAIENKLYSGSVSDMDQLKDEYEGLKNIFTDQKIIIIFLVPCEVDGGVIPKDVDECFKNINMKQDCKDQKFLLSWQDNSWQNDKGKKIGSISSIVSSLISDDSIGAITPIQEYTRHTLKAFNNFILNSFSGYTYTKQTSCGGGGGFPKKTIKELLNQSTGFVGVVGRIANLLEKNYNDIKSRSFQFTESGKNGERNWISLEDFKEIVNWLESDIPPVDFKWNGTYKLKGLRKIVEHFKGVVYVGIQGGKNGLERMSADDVRKKNGWEVSGREIHNPNWMPASDCYDLLKAKGFFK